MEDGRDSDRPRAHEARGLDRNELFPNRTNKRPRMSLNTPPRPRGLHPVGVLARPHRKKATTLRLQFINKQASRRVIAHSPKGTGATVGTNSTGVPTSSDNKKNKTTKPQRNAAHLRTACQVRLVRGRLDGAPRPRSGSDSYEAPSTGVPRPHPVRRGTSTTLRLA
jgi:hypothetical protein